ncbi:hypothetical protein Q9966_007230 [Columba livia]|nr:hypothetical protein Q9966_007230 [Columba livia]
MSGVLELNCNHATVELRSEVEKSLATDREREYYCTTRGFLNADRGPGRSGKVLLGRQFNLLAIKSPAEIRLETPGAVETSREEGSIGQYWRLILRTGTGLRRRRYRDPKVRLPPRRPPGNCRLWLRWAQASEPSVSVQCSTGDFAHPAGKCFWANDTCPDSAYLLGNTWAHLFSFMLHPRELLEIESCLSYIMAHSFMKAAKNCLQLDSSLLLSSGGDSPSQTCASLGRAGGRGWARADSSPLDPALFLQPADVFTLRNGFALQRPLQNANIPAETGYSLEINMLAGGTSGCILSYCKVEKLDEQLK